MVPFEKAKSPILLDFI